MPQRGEGPKIPPRPAAEVEDREQRRALDVAQQRGDILADVVVLRAGAKVLRALLVVLERPGGDPGKLVGSVRAQAAIASAAARIARAAAAKAAGSGEATDTRRATASFGKFVGAERL